jgi:hypothetical protein
MLFLVATAVERAMKLQEVILRALSGALTWVQAADILGIDPRSLRRWRARYEVDQQLGLYERRQLPSPCKAPVGVVQQILRLYRETYRGFNVRPCHYLLRRDHGMTLSYSFVRLALQEAGLVAKRRGAVAIAARREPRPCFGDLLHLDGSPHPWLALRPHERHTLIAVLDDATTHLLYAQLWPANRSPRLWPPWPTSSTSSACRGPCTLIAPAGPSTPPRLAAPPIASTSPTWAVPSPGSASSTSAPIPPQARGRGERLNRTLQDRLVNELPLAGITTIDDANAYLRDRFIPDYNATFARPPADPALAFVPLGAVDLDQVLCEEEERTAAPDNTVTVDAVRLQISKQPGQPTCAGRRVLVRRHYDGSHSLWRGPHCLGQFAPHGAALPAVLARATPAPQNA